MASHSPLLSGTIEADEDSLPAPTPKGSIGSSAKPQREPVVLVPGTSAGSTRAATLEEGGIVRLHITDYGRQERGIKLNEFGAV